ncbi:MAG TPA: HIT family protein [bacterium]|nr:HIT family protein [bacterium]
MPCPFCNIQPERIVASDELVFCILDRYPVTEGHALVMPRRHVANFFDLTAQEGLALAGMIKKAKAFLDERFKPQGYNVGVNVGRAAGQTIDHVHVHLIPRYDGDMENPRGGVRGVIPKKQKYP